MFHRVWLGAVAVGTAAVLFSSTEAAAETPMPPSKARVTRRLSHSMWIGGAAMAAAGVGNMFYGWAVWVIPSTNSTCEGCPLEPDEEVARGFFVAGVVSLALGVPMIIVGTRNVEVNEPAAIMPTEVRMGPGSVSARWVF